MARPENIIDMHICLILLAAALLPLCISGYTSKGIIEGGGGGWQGKRRIDGSKKDIVGKIETSTLGEIIIIIC